MSGAAYAFTLRLRVDNPAALARAAAARAAADGLPAWDWRTMRATHPTGPLAADLIMLLDPGGVPGCSVHDSTATLEDRP